MAETRLIGIPAELAAQLRSLLTECMARAGGPDERWTNRTVVIYWLGAGESAADELREVTSAPVVVLAEDSALPLAAGRKWPAHWQWAPWPLSAARLGHHLSLAQQAAPAAPELDSSSEWKTVGQRLIQALRGARMYEFEYDLATGARQDNIRRQFGNAPTPRSFDDMLAFVHPDYRAEVGAAYACSRETGAEFRVSMPVRVDSEDHRWMRSVGRVFDRQPGHPGRLLGISWDIRDEQLAKESAALAQQRLDDALTIGGMLSWEWRRGDRGRRLVSDFSTVLADSPEHLEGLIDPGDREADRVRFQTAIERGERYHSEVWFRQPGKRAQRMLLCGLPGLDPSGAATTMQGIALDLTEQYELQQELTQASELLVESLQTAKMFCWQWDPNSENAQVLGPCEEILGVRLTNPLSMQGLIHPQDAAQQRRMLDNAICDQTEFTNEYRIVRPDHAVRWLRTRAKPVHDEHGKLLRIVGLSIDVTRSRSDRKAIEQASERLETALEAAALNPWTVDLATGERIAGPRDQALFGEPVGNLDAFRSLVLAEDRALTDQVVATALGPSAKPIHVEFRVQHRDGQLRWISTYAKAIRDGQGNPTHLVGVSRDISEAREAQDQLAQTLVQLDRVQAATKVVLWEWNRGDGVVCYTAGGQHLRGAALPELHRGHRWSVARALLRCSRSEAALDLEVRVADRNGRYGWVQLKGRRTEFAADGSPIISGVMIDIAANVRDRERAARAEERLRNALDAAKMRCWDWETTFVPAQSDALTGYTPTVKGSGASPPGEIHPDDRAAHRAAIVAAMADPSHQYRNEFRVIQADGRVSWLLSIGKGVMDHNRGRFRLAGVAIDISAQKEMQRQLAESRSWQSVAVEVAELNLWRMDMETGKRDGGARERLLYDCEPETYSELRALIHPEDLKEIDQKWQWCLRNQTDCQADYRVRTARGAQRWLRVRARSDRDPTNGHVIAIGATRDVTDQIESQREMERALTQAEQASTAKSAFLASISHELRTPLNAVVGYANLLAERSLGAADQEYLKALRSGAEQLLSLVNDVLDFSRIEAGEMLLESIPFSVQECLESALDVVAGDAEAKGLCLLMTSNGNQASEVLGDPTRLRQVLVNLLSNAVKFTEQGEIEVALETEARGDSLVVRCTVRDTGIGMDESVLARLFQPFHQAEVATTRRYGGTGLGLSISKHLLTALGGQITCKSVRGEGTVFKIQIQLPTVHSSAPTEPEAKLPQRALVIAKSAAVRSALRYQLGEYGVECVLIAPSDFAEALCAQSTAADVLIVGEPILAGLSALPQWPRDRQGQPMPVIVLSGMQRSMQAAVGAQGQRQIPISRALKPRTLHAALVNAANPAPSSAGAVVNRPQSATLDLVDLSVLVVEDNEINRTLIQLQLKALGAQVVCAESGSEALRLIGESAFDVVLMDLEMPDMDGLETTRRIRAAEKDGNGPYIVAVTAHVLSGVRERIEAAGMNDFVSKPVNVVQLHQSLQRGMGARQGWESARQ